jgi:cellulose synthase/poly-beta-1,6-N-acetylglucosamine synthase-like glycosyltransferase
VVVLVLKGIIVVVVVVMIVYAIRHYRFTVNRLLGEQRLYYQDLLDSELPSVSVLVPMHDEERVARQCLAAILACRYPAELLEIIPIDDHSRDATWDILRRVASDQPRVRPLRRSGGQRGKPAALNEGMRAATGEIVIVFDADYLPGRGVLRDLAVCFRDPAVGAVMGRVIPINTKTNLLTRLMDLERSGGYQVDQQARHNLDLLPQYGGTVGAYRRELALQLGGFAPRVLAEDTDLTFRLYLAGWQVTYANRVECYEEAPENWTVRSRQIRRWSRGHNFLLLQYLGRVLRSPLLSRRQKLDGALLLGVYTVPVFLFAGIVSSVLLFLLGQMQIVESLLVLLCVAAYNVFGNFAPFYQIGVAALLDGVTHRVRLLPFLTFYFLLNIWVVTAGFAQALVDRFRGGPVEWEKTTRHRAATP